MLKFNISGNRKTWHFMATQTYYHLSYLAKGKLGNNGHKTCYYVKFQEIGKHVTLWSQKRVIISQIWQ